MTRGTLLGAAALVAVAGAAHAQNACREDFTMPAAGSWAQYRMVNKKDTSEMRFAILGREERAGKTYHWVEMAMTGKKKNQNAIIQVLAPGFPYEPGDVQEMVMKPGDQPAMKMSGAMLGMARGAMKQQGLSPAELCKRSTFVAEETVEVPAGRFTARKYRDEEHKADAWVVKKTPFGWVKSEGRDYSMVLVSTGSGAKSSITETPREMGAAPGATPN